MKSKSYYKIKKKLKSKENEKRKSINLKKEFNKKLMLLIKEKGN